MEELIVLRAPAGAEFPFCVAARDASNTYQVRWALKSEGEAHEFINGWRAARLGWEEATRLDQVERQGQSPL